MHKNSWVQNSGVYKIIKYNVIVWGIVKKKREHFIVNLKKKKNNEKGSKRRIFQVKSLPGNFKNQFTTELRDV